MPTSIPDWQKICSKIWLALRQQLTRLLIMMETFLPLQRVKTKAAQIVAVCICSSTHQWCDTSSKHCPGNGTMAHSHTRPAPGILKIQSGGVALRKLRRWLAHIKTRNKHSQGVSNVCCSIWGDRHIFKHLLLLPWKSYLSIFVIGCEGPNKGELLRSKCSNRVCGFRSLTLSHSSSYSDMERTTHHFSKRETEFEELL